MGQGSASKKASELLFSGEMEDMSIHAVLARMDAKQQTLENNVASLQQNQQAQFNKIDTAIQALSQKINDKSTTNWGVMTPMIVAICAAVLWVGKVQVDNSVNPMRADMAAFKESLLSVASTARNDSKDLHEIADTLNYSVSELEKKQGEDRVRNEAQLATIAAKFDNYRDVINSNKELMVSGLNQLYVKGGMAPFLPSTPYYMRPVSQ